MFNLFSYFSFSSIDQIVHRGSGREQHNFNQTCYLAVANYTPTYKTKYIHFILYATVSYVQALCGRELKSGKVLDKDFQITGKFLVEIVYQLQYIILCCLSEILSLVYSIRWFVFLVLKLVLQFI